MKDGSRKIVNISEVQGMEGEVVVMQDIFVFEQTGVENGRIRDACGLPAFARASWKRSRLLAFTCHLPFLAMAICGKGICPPFAKEKRPWNN